MNNEEFIKSKVQTILGQSEKILGPLRPPIDPIKIAEICGISVEVRSMVPEGGLGFAERGFQIYVQDDFRGQRRVTPRQRFTIAHELAHTFFYEMGDSAPKRIKGSPAGEKLERPCNIGAEQILVPERLIRRTIHQSGGFDSVNRLFSVAEDFGVSAEVLMRRLHSLRLIDEERFAAVLVSVIEGKRIIQSACYGPQLSCFVSADPKRGTDLDSWIRPLAPQGRPSAIWDWIQTTPNGRVAVKRYDRSKSSFLLELRFELSRANCGQT